MYDLVDENDLALEIYIGFAHRAGRTFFMDQLADLGSRCLKLWN